MADLKLSDLDPNDVTPVKSPEEPKDAPKGPLKLSDIHPDDVKPVEAPETPQYGLPSTILHQGAQGATLGYSDEIAGALGALGDKGKALAKGEDTKDFMTLYKQYRDSERQKLKDMQQQHPVASVASQIGGGLATALVPGLGEASLGKMAAQGAIAGLGASNADLTRPSMANVGQAAEDTALGGGLGLAGGAVANKVGQFLAPEARTLAGNTQLANASGVFQKEAGNLSPQKVAQIGQTISENNASPLTGGAQNMLQKTRDAITHNENKLTPIFQRAQENLDNDIPTALQKVGNIGDKGANLYYQFADQLQGNPNKDKILDNIYKTYAPYLEQLSKVDGNLTQLNTYKKGLQQAAKDMNAYSASNPDLKDSAVFAKQLASTVRQHIEDLGNAAPGGWGDSIKQTNGTLSNLYNTEDMVEKLADKSAKGVPLIGAKEGILAATGLATGHGPITAAAILGKKAVELGTGNPFAQTVRQVAGKANIGLGKTLDTGAGQIVQKAGVQAANQTFTNPFIQGKASAATPHLNSAYALYNADDDSLKDISNTMSQNPQTKNISHAFDKYFKTNDPTDKNNAIFLVQQNKDAMKLLQPEK